MTKDTFKKIIFLITYTMVLMLVLLNIKSILVSISNIINVLSPLWIGIILAFVLNVPMSIIENNAFEKKENMVDKKVRMISLTLSIMIIIILLFILFVWVIPDFIDSTTYLVGQIPSLIDSLNNFLVNTFKNTDLSEYIGNLSNSAEVTGLISGIFKNIINNFTGVLSNFVSLIINLLTGIIISIYLLLEKEHILNGINNFLHKVLDEKITKKIDEVLKLSNKCFHDFITYQCLECLILGVLMFVALVLFRFPYALTISFMATVTAIVPIIGATIACIIGAILIGTTSIKQAIIFLIVFQVIQQIEGNIIYPKVVGKHVGLPPIATIVALIVGGAVAGLFGMLICIPITSIVYSLFKTKIKELESKKKKVET